jgi:hypothetical protein
VLRQPETSHAAGAKSIRAGAGSHLTITPGGLMRRVSVTVGPPDVVFLPAVALCFKRM